MSKTAGTAIENRCALFMVIMAIGLVATHLGRKCPKCGSRKTLSWTEETRDASYNNIMHTNVNRYCFKCADFTVQDDFALLLGNLRSNLTYRLACAHHRKHHKKDVI